MTENHLGQHIFILILFLGALGYLFLLIRKQMILRKNSGCGSGSANCKCEVPQKWDHLADKVEGQKKSENG